MRVQSQTAASHRAKANLLLAAIGKKAHGRNGKVGGHRIGVSNGLVASGETLEVPKRCSQKVLYRLETCDAGAEEAARKQVLRVAGESRRNNGRSWVKIRCHKWRQSLKAAGKQSW
jgi:hypothetical protein